MKTTLFALTCVASLFAFAATADAQKVGDTISATVYRGDANGDRTIDHADAQTMLDILFGGARPHVSLRDLDLNRDGRFDIADVDTLIASLAKSGRPTPAVAKSEPTLLGDVNDDGRVDIADLSSLYAWFSTGQRPAGTDESFDVSGDGKDDLADLIELQRVVGF